MFDFGTVSNAAQAQAENTEAVSWQGNFPAPETYRKSFDTVENYLKAGDISLINLTCRVPVSTNLSLRDIFCRAEAKYKLWLKDTLVCFSPEILCASNGEISSYPMKYHQCRPARCEAIIMNDVKEAENISRWYSSSATT